ncbi:MFS transporter [Enterococcus ureasiticus]|uniref:MFS transporter n=1 Tax=Enterococcus ureasiticus TaxID=903984 RepID=UPI001A9086A1|nr:MFS transporter [Enterococcus ureasiticus]MBO0473807.1 MFS transporter [Enterococcus ureasiticus]
METQVEKTVVNKSSAGLIFALMAGYSMIYMDKSMISTAIITMAEEFSLDTGQTGLIMSFFFLGYSLMQIPGGWLADKIGAKKVLMLSLAIISIFSFAFGAVSSLMLFMVIRFFAGLGHGGYPPSCSKSIADNFPQERRTFIQSLILSTSGIGGILAFTLGANLININWRYGYLALGTLFAVALVLVGVFVPKQATSEKTSGNKPAIKFSQVITNRNVLVLFVAMLLLNFLLYGNMSWLPSFLAKKFAIDIKTISYLLAVNAIFQTIATMFAGKLLSKLFLGKERIFIISATVLAAILVAAFVASNNLVVSMICLISVSMVSISAFTAIFTWPHKIMDPSIIGSSIGIINTGGTLGGFLAPMILGQLIKAAGGSFTLAFGFMAVASLLCGLCVLGVKKEA